MPALTIITHSFQDLKEYIEKAISIIPSTGDVLREVDRARTPESRVRVWSRSLDPIDSVASLIGIEEVGVGIEVTWVRLPGYNRHSTRSRPLLLRTCQTTDSNITTSDLANYSSCCLAFTCEVIAKFYTCN